MIKVVQDKTFAINRSHPSFHSQAYWEWALGDDNELYVRGRISGFYYSNWIPFTETSIGLSLSDIRYIYKNFDGY